ncbi:Gfo/Idh/MocA family protein [Qipengyuania sp.]|uniref:Gfo/Idh/MocA family protein n=1 Tax=Qipengyuania sp. TaxID=2004515 RepID=UPI0035C7A0FF
MDRIKIGLVGIGKIARDQHLPALRGSSVFALGATTSHEGTVDGVRDWPSLASLLDGDEDIGAVSFCTPPMGRYEQALAAIQASRHVMLEKPPALTVTQATALEKVAAARGVTLFAAWHSREAAHVATARAWLANKAIRAVRITWREDIRRWHPGQDWILSEGGFGVFDPGINALSIATQILPAPLVLIAAELAIPENRACPIAAKLAMSSGGARVDADFDFLQEGPQIWDIEIDTDAGTLRLQEGGRIVQLPHSDPLVGNNGEYVALYEAFGALIRSGESDVDLQPLQLVTDALAIGERSSIEPFQF